MQEIALAIEGESFRIVQEALANVARHSQASHVTPWLDVSTGVSFTISDNDHRHVSKSGVGLASMRERMDALHGQVEIHSKAGRGTTIIVRCDQHPEPQQQDTSQLRFSL